MAGATSVKIIHQGPVHMIPWQLTDPEINFASVHSLMPVTINTRFSLPRGTLRGGLPAVQHRVIPLDEVTFLHVNRMQKLPQPREVLRIPITDVQNKFHNKKFQKAPEIGKCI